MSFLTETIFDHRTKAREPYPLRGRALDRFHESQLPCASARRIRAAITASRPRFRASRSIPFMPAIMGVGLFINVLRIGYVWLNIAAIGGLGLVSLVVLALHRSASGIEIVRAFLAERRCPCCAYNLAGAAPDPDGLTTCPECGAAWKLPTGPPNESPA